MKTTLSLSVLCLALLMGCSSKNNNPAPANTKHTIKVTANAAQEYGTGVWVQKNDGTPLGTALDGKTVTGNYEFTTTAEVGQSVVYRLQSYNNTDLSYTIIDNGEEKANVTHLNLNNNERSTVYLVK